MKVVSIPCPDLEGAWSTGIWGIDGPETALPGDRGIAGDLAGLPDADRAASAEAAAAADRPDLGRTADHPATTPLEGAPAAAASPAMPAEPASVPRVKIDAPRVEGSINLLGAKLDDLVLKDYREEIAPTSPLVRLLEPRSQAHPYYIQYGWTAPEGQTTKLPATTRPGPHRRTSWCRASR